MKIYIKSSTDFPEYSNDIKSLGVLLFESPDVVIGKRSSSDNYVYVYKFTEYNSPHRGNKTTGWLNSGIWKQYPDGLWYKYNSVSGGKLSDGVKTLEQIAAAVKKED